MKTGSTNSVNNTDVIKPKVIVQAIAHQIESVTNVKIQSIVVTFVAIIGPNLLVVDLINASSSHNQLFLLNKYCSIKMIAFHVTIQIRDNTHKFQIELNNVPFSRYRAPNHGIIQINQNIKVVIMTPQTAKLLNFVVIIKKITMNDKIIAF